MSARDPSAQISSLNPNPGSFINLRRAVDCMTSDSAGVNRKARDIVALRHPQTIHLPCFTHLAALDCADLLKLSIAEST